MDFARVEVTSRDEWRAWLERHHRQADSIWLVRWKKAAGDRYLDYDAVVEEALCFGWIDSLPRKLDDARTMLLLSPRKPGSAWSAVNKARVERLTAAGRMAAPGLAVVAAARRDGSWSRIDDAQAMRVPDDLRDALAAHGDAARHFAEFPPSAKRGILEWIGNAKTPATRAKRIADTAAKAADNVRANQYRQPASANREGGKEA